jgi:CRISPR-associated protein Cas1
VIKRIIDISEGPTYLQIENDQLVLTRHADRVAAIPCEDIGVVLIDHPAVTYTHAALTRLLHHGAVVIPCGKDHLPAGILLPLENNDLHTARLRAQVKAGLPLRKQLWKQIVEHKIRGQALNLPESNSTRTRLLVMATEVKSGDVSNCEGQAARSAAIPTASGPIRS